MKIGVVAAMAGSPWGGSEELWAAMAREAISQGHEVAISIYTFRAAATVVVALEKFGARVLPRPLPRWRNPVYRLRRKLRPPFAGLRAFRPEVLCISQGGTYDIVSEFLADLGPIVREDSIPYVVRCAANTEAPLDETSRRQAYEFLAGAAKVLWGSRRNHLSTERQLGRRLPRVQIVRSPVNLADTSIVAREPVAPVQFACVGRLETYHKGQDLLLEALAAAPWRSRDWELGFYGGGRDLGYLSELAAHYEISEKVRFRGHMNDVRAIWAANDLLVLPSRVEGAPLALREAMLCGRPAVVTDVGGNAEWVEEARTGFVADGATAISLGAALERAWAARAEWKEMGERAHAVALERHDPTPGKTFLQILVDAARGSQCNKSAFGHDDQ